MPAAMAEQPVLRFGGLLRQLRARARLTQEELGEAAGLSPRSVSDLERGINRTARKDSAEMLADALGLAEPARGLFVAAARGRAPAEEVLGALRGQAEPGSGPAWAGCPYLGLVPFEERDARVFYGRGELTGQLVQKLAARLDGTGILLVAGESGTGKSSLLRAGLMPQLAAGALGPGSERWPRRVIRPANSPLRELAMQLAELASADPVSVYRSLSAAPGEAPTLAELAVRTATGRGGRARSRRPADAAAAPPRLILVVDQFEELFTAGEDTEVGRAEREAFIAALRAVATGPAGPQHLPPALVVAAVRADFLGRLIAYPPLKAALDAGPFTVGPMSEAELRLAMTGPAAETGLAVEPALVEAVIAELREGTGAGMGSGVLPLMSQAMAAAWELREGSELTLCAYRRAGGVADVVNRSAQAAYDTLTSPQKDAARLVFTQLTVITPDGRFARRQCSESDLHAPGTQTADVDAIIDIFRAHRLLVLGKDGVELAHDVLLQAWKQLRDWLGDDQHDRALYSQVVTDAATWESNRRDSSYLYRPGRLATIDAAVTRWQNAPTRYPRLPATSKAFLDAAHHAARRSGRRRRSAFAILALLTALAVAAAVVASYQRAAAVRQRNQAIYNQVIAEALQSAASDPTLAAQLTLAAYRIQPAQDAASRLLNTENTPLSAQFTVGTRSVYSVAFSPDARTLASLDDGAVRLWDIANPARPRLLGTILTGGAGSISSVALSPDRRTLASGSYDGTVRLWDIADPTHPRLLSPILTGSSSAINTNASETIWSSTIASVAFSRDGRTLASGSLDGTVGIWDVADPAHVRSWGQSPASGSFRAVSVAFSPGGRTLASGSLNGAVRLWDSSDRAHPRLLSPIPTSGTAAVYAVAFSGDGRTLASGSNDGTIRLWDVADSTQPRPLGLIPTGGTAAISSVAFSRDGRTLASGSNDGTIRLWDVANPARPHRRHPGGGVRPRRAHASRWQRQRHHPTVEPPSNCPDRRRGRDQFGGVQPRRAHAGQRQQRRHHPAVGRRQSRPAQPAQLHPDRRHGRHRFGGVQPRRAHAGQRQQRRHHPAVGRRQSRPAAVTWPAPCRPRRRLRQFGGGQSRWAHPGQRRRLRWCPSVVGCRQSRASPPARAAPCFQRARHHFGGVQPRWAHAGQRRRRWHRPSVGCHRSHAAPAGRSDRYQRYGRHHFGGVQFRRAHAGHRRLRWHRPSVGCRRSRTPPPTRPDPDQRHGRNQIGRVQPRRAHAGHRRQRRHGPSVGCRRSRPTPATRPAPDGQHHPRRFRGVQSRWAHAGHKQR
jgi:transcriptional regulator with XRE-family HTH domain